jgi:hypothetical protein
MLEPIRFRCDGTRGMATIVAVLEKGYLVDFTDGYQSKFILDGSGNWTDDYLQSQHLQLIKRDLASLQGFENYKFRRCFAIEINGRSLNAFVVSKDETAYEVRYQGQYQFTLCKTNKKWQVTAGQGKGVDKDAVESVLFWLEPIQNSTALNAVH